MGNSSFEHSFRRALNCVKANVDPKTGTRHDKAPFTAGDRTLVASIGVGLNDAGNQRVYDFWQKAGTAEDILGSLITINGPAYYERRREWGKMKELVAFLEPGGKVKHQKPNRHTRDAVDEAVGKFWEKMGLRRHEAAGWDISSYFKDDGISPGVHVLRRKKNGLMEEYAIARPRPHGRSFDYYHPASAYKTKDRLHPQTPIIRTKISFDKRTKISHLVGNQIEALMDREGYFNTGKGVS